MARKKRKTKKRKTQRNPLGMPWWAWVLGGAGLLYFSSKGTTTAGGLTMADLEKTVNAALLGKATNVKGTVGDDGSVTVAGKYGGNETFTFIKASSMTDAFTKAQQLSPTNPSVGMGSYAMGVCPSCF